MEVDEQDIWLKFSDECTTEIEVLKVLQEQGILDPKLQVWLEEMEDRLGKLSESPKYRQIYIDRLMCWGDMSSGRPSRRSGMTLEQETLCLFLYATMFVYVCIGVFTVYVCM